MTTQEGMSDLGHARLAFDAPRFMLARLKSGKRHSRTSIAKALKVGIKNQQGRNGVQSLCAWRLVETTLSVVIGKAQ